MMYVVTEVLYERTKLEIKASAKVTTQVILRPYLQICSSFKFCGHEIAYASKKVFFESVLREIL